MGVSRSSVKPPLHEGTTFQSGFRHMALHFFAYSFSLVLPLAFSLSHSSAAENGLKETHSNDALKGPSVKGLVARTMKTRERVLALAPGVDVFFQAVFVFTSAWVEATFGTTGRARCVRDAGLRKYLLDEEGPRKLSRAEVEVLARAFSGLARMQLELAGEPVRQEEAAEAVEGVFVSFPPHLCGQPPATG